MDIEKTISISNPVQHTIFQCRDYLNNQILGQQQLIDRLLVALLADGHLLVEGAPGLAKTKAIKTLAECIESDFHRIQFTPDLLPSDLTGTEIYRPQTGEFVFQKGPLFHNILLADEINRAPAKVQSALLEAMAERQITVGRKTYTLPNLFLVMATQNPLEQEGTYPLPEAQLDRFLLHVTIDYPSIEAEREILKLVRAETLQAGASVNERPQITQDELFQIRQSLFEIHLAPQLEEYIVQFIAATRQPKPYSDSVAESLSVGASPRATLALDRCSRALAWLNGREFVTPDDIQALIPDVLRHRLILSYQAEAQGLTADDVINELIERVPVP